MTVNGDTVILTGGTTVGRQTLASTIMWKPGQDSWTSVSNMQQARFYHCSVSDNSNIVYVLGGYVGSSLKSSVERYNQWQLLSDMPRALCVIGCVYVNRTIIVTCGWTGSRGVDTMFLYSVLSDTWTTSPTHLMTQTHDHMMAIIK